MANVVKPPELLAPAGDRDCLRAAIENGADAVYFGLEVGFNARARAKNFLLSELPEIVELLHRRGVLAYVTVNTLVFPSELARLESHIRAIAAAGVDAVLVQDLGVVRLVRDICPDLSIHASTQMTLTSAESIAVAQSLGIERVVLARECSLQEIREIRRHTTMPLEVFVHGALCVAYSGQCLTSESLGGRSANRGQCAQACRLPYDLVCDGRQVDLGAQKYLLSPQDLAAYDLIPELIEAGVCALKIEGRLKTPEYVANITAHYRRAIDAAMAGQPAEFSPRDVEEMELSFSRGFSHGWLEGCDHKMLVPAWSSAKRGVLLGTVKGMRGGRVVVQLGRASPRREGGDSRQAGRLPQVKRGDGLVFDCGEPVDDEQGGRVYEIFVRGRSVESATSGVVELGFARGAIDLEQIWPGQQVWKNDDPELTGRLRKTFIGKSPLRRLPLDLYVTAAVGRPLVVKASVGQAGRLPHVTIESQDLLAAAERHPLSEETLRQQFGRLGGTPFELRSLAADITGSPMCPFSVLGKLRHELVTRVEALLAERPARRIAAADALPSLRAAHTPPTEAPLAPQLHILCRSLDQLAQVLALGCRSVYADFQDIREYRQAVEAARAAGAAIFLATPRIQKQGEAGIFHALARHGADGILVRNLGGLDFFHRWQVPLVADFSLNCANDLSAQFLAELGAARITPSYDLNRDQLLDLVSAVEAPRLEVVIHQHMPMFHMEHCVFCAVLSPGTNKTNCGRPCDRHRVELRDRLGMAHPLAADVGCRNTLFNAVPQSAAEIVPVLLEKGLRHFRIEFLHDSGQPLARTLDLYRELLAGRIAGREVWRQLRAVNRVGVTRGTIEERRDPLAIL
jgi:putative protease